MRLRPLAAGLLLLAVSAAVGCVPSSEPPRTAPSSAATLALPPLPAEHAATTSDASAEHSPLLYPYNLPQAGDGPSPIAR